LKNVKNNKNAIELFKLAERLLYRVLIVDERVIKYVLGRHESDIENLHYSGINVGIIRIKKLRKSVFKDQELIEKIEKIHESNKKYLPFLEVDVIPSPRRCK